MGDTKIEWADKVFNPWVGCTKVSDACDNCYAESWAKRSGLVQWGNHPRRRTTESYWRQPLKWNRWCEKNGLRHRVFCASLADVFDNQVPGEWRTDLWRLIRETPHLDWLLLTKRPQNISKMPPGPIATRPWPWPNVWLGTTVENQEEANQRIPHLLAVSAVRRFLSCEPLLASVRLDMLQRESLNGTLIDNALTGFRSNGFGGIAGPKIDWIIAGGESGPKARPPMIGWIRALRDQCWAAGVPFFFKQWGEFAPDDPAAAHTAMTRVGKKAAGALLDGREWRQFPQGVPS